MNLIVSFKTSNTWIGLIKYSSILIYVNQPYQYSSYFVVGIFAKDLFKLLFIDSSDWRINQQKRFKLLINTVFSWLFQVIFDSICSWLLELSNIEDLPKSIIGNEQFVVSHLFIFTNSTFFNTIQLTSMNKLSNFSINVITFFYDRKKLSGICIITSFADVLRWSFTIDKRTME